MYSVHFMDKDGNVLSNSEREQLSEYMAENGLIRINGENCHLDLKSEHICDSGWIEHLKSKQEGKFEKYTLKVLENLRNGEEAAITKSETNEVHDIIKKLKNAEIAEASTGGVKVPIKNRKYITKLIELQSWHEFLNWYDEENTNGHTTNYFIGENKGIVNQSSNFSNSPQTANTTAKTQPTTQKNFIKKFWKLISENKLISSIILAIILYLVKIFFGIEL